VASASAGRAGFTSYTGASGTVTTENFSSDSSNLAGFNDEMGYDEEDSFEDPLFSGMALSGVREPEIRDQAWREAEMGAMPEMRLIMPQRASPTMVIIPMDREDFQPEFGMPEFDINQFFNSMALQQSPQVCTPPPS
jgi:hypothetical protein